VHPHVINLLLYSFLTVIYLTLVVPEPAASATTILLAVMPGFVRVEEVYWLFEHFLSCGASIHYDLQM